ncbi:hypothetical protein GW17_00044093 [Ensete ventricosum]|nr:hypothetical protein GW17_00044093 [Ensete ventricosum]
MGSCRSKPGDEELSLEDKTDLKRVSCFLEKGLELLLRVGVGVIGVGVVRSRSLEVGILLGIKSGNRWPQWYIPVRQVIGPQSVRYRMIPPKIDCWRSISTVDGRLKEKLTVGDQLRRPLAVD